MKTHDRIRLTLLLVCSGFLVACSGSSSKGVGFAVPAKPSTDAFASGAPNNQAPPPSLLAPEIVRRPKVDRELTAAERAQAALDGAALARAHLAAMGYAATVGVGGEEIHTDEYGRVHVKLHQLHDGVRVLGAGIAAHLEGDAPDEVTTGLVRGITIGTVPSVPEVDALGTARARYPVRGATLVETSELVVAPELELVPLGTTQHNSSDFDYVLRDAKLAWEITLAPPPLDRAAFAASIRASTATNDDDDDPGTIGTHEDNVVRGGHPSPEPAQDFMAQLNTPPMRYLVDAQTGAVLSEEADIVYGDQPATGTGFGYYNGRVRLSTTYDDALDRYFLIDGSRPEDGVGNITWDARNDETHDADEMLLMGDKGNSWGDGDILASESAAYVSTRRQTPAVDIAYGVQVTWDLFENVFDRTGLDGQGTSIWTAAHWGDDYTDAHFNGSSGFAVFGDNDELDEAGLYAINWVGHELGHNFWRASGLASKAGESSAMNEGHGDVMGSLVLFYRDTSNGDGALIRRVPAFGDWAWRLRTPELYSPSGVAEVGQRYWSAGLKDLEEHVAGLPFGRAVIHLAEGSPADSDADMYTTEFPGGMAGIGVNKAAHIWNLAVSSYLVGTPTYADARLAFLAAAKYLYGAGSMEHNAVQRAFHAIRVGPNRPDLADPEVVWAGLWDVNLTDMTALAFPLVEDDTGVRSVRVEGVNPNLKNRGFHDGDFLLGYVNISRAPLGQSSVVFTVEDGAGRTATATRSFVKAADRNLITNGDFEDGLASWTTAAGDPHVATDERRAFIGTSYLALDGDDDVEQQVTVPAGASRATLVFRVQARNGVTKDDLLSVEVRDAGGQPLEQLALYDQFTPSKADRSFLNKGYHRQEFDLSHYAGDTIRIGFRNQTPEDAYRFVFDQVVLTYEQDVFVDVPAVALAEWENTVAFQLPTIEGLQDVEIERVEYWTDQGLSAISQNPAHDWYASEHLDELGPGAHWVGARVRGLDNQVLANSAGVWFVPYAVNELIEDGGFEEGPWDLTYSSVAPRVEVEENTIHGTISYDGNQVLRMGGQGSAHSSQAGQVVQVPKSIKTLDFSCRVEVGAQDPTDADNLDLELWDANKFELIESFPVAEADHEFSTPGTSHSFKDFGRRDISLSPGKYAGKSVIVILKVHEFEDGDVTNFWVDNVSLRYTNFGIVLPPDDGGGGDEI